MEKDFYSNIFFSDNERYADIINGIGCDGISFVKGKDLQELDTRVYHRGRKGIGRRYRRKKTLYRDLVRKTPFGINFAIVGIENQEEIDYALPLRTMCYDAGTYEKQAAGIRRQVRRKAKGLSAGEYLYGFQKSSRLFPTVTLVLYYGDKEWDGAKDLHGLIDFTDIPDSLREKVSNYRIHVIEVRKLKDTDIFQTDVKQVFDFIRFSKDKRKLKELIEHDPAYAFLEEDAYDMVAGYAGEEEMFKIKDKHKKGGKVDMCQGLREWMEDERNEGRAEGRADGKAEGKAEERERMNQLIVMLTAQSRVEDLVRAAKDADYQERLFQELGI
ncbi:MAG: Rpn family recombination-promoting nuclease/putative transposase [Lachnospiraceae bacterium]|nr:Rpn family recombination-promoting nuclease/putative transposase [Lachnospiraceae bacterium]